MNIGINPQHFQKAALWEEDRTIFETFDLVSDAGFKCLDFSIGDRVTAEKVAEYISLKGITVNQSHMPMNRYAKKDFEEFKKDVMCHAENAKLMGSKYLQFTVMSMTTAQYIHAKQPLNSITSFLTIQQTLPLKTV